MPLDNNIAEVLRPYGTVVSWLINKTPQFRIAFFYMAAILGINLAYVQTKLISKEKAYYSDSKYAEHLLMTS